MLTQSDGSCLKNQDNFSLNTVLTSSKNPVRTWTKDNPLDCIGQSVVHLTREQAIPGSIPGPAAYFCSPSADSRRAIVSYQ